MITIITLVMSAKCGKYIYDPNNEFGNGRFGHVFIAENEDEVKKGEKKYYVLKIHEENDITDDDKQSFNDEIKILSLKIKLFWDNY